MSKYLDLSANVNLSIEDILGEKTDDNKNREENGKNDGVK